MRVERNCKSSLLDEVEMYSLVLRVIIILLLNSGDIYWLGPVVFTFHIERVFHVKNSRCHFSTLYSCFFVSAKCLV